MHVCVLLWDMNCSCVRRACVSVLVDSAYPSRVNVTRPEASPQMASGQVALTTYRPKGSGAA